MKNFSKTMKNIFMNFRSDKYFMCAVLPIKESMFLSYMWKMTLILEISYAST